ncbi:MAG: hypothetical protein Q8R04_02170, partial [Nanoarchaeota archaeon]|nr:hypothetical protein [Nanoarchaeota archaeon]
MPYAVTANVTGEPARIQQRDNQTLFYNRGEAEEFQRSLRLSGFDRVDIIEMDEPRPPETITAPASTPDRQGRPISQSQAVVDVATGKNVPYSESRQAQIEENIARAAREKPAWAMQQGNLQSVRQQSYQQAQGDFGQKILNLSTQERAIQTARQKEAERIAERASQFVTAGPMLMEFRKLPTKYQTSQTLKGIAEVSALRRQELAPKIYQEGIYKETKIPISTYERAEPKGYAEKIARLGSELRFAGEFRSEGFGRQSKGLGGTALAAISVPVFAATRPWDFIKGFVKTISRPDITLKEMGSELQTDPGKVIGDIIGGYFVGAGVSRGVRASPIKFRYESIKIPLRAKPSEVPGMEIVTSKKPTTPKLISDVVKVKDTPGLQTSFEIKDFVQRAKAIAGIEKAPSEVKTMFMPFETGKGGLIAVRKTPGAEPGISKIPSPEPTTLTKKGNIIFKELGIEEGGILKAEFKTKKKPTTPADISIAVFGIESKGRAFVVGGKTPEGLQLGTPRLSKRLQLSELREAIPSPRTATATKSLMNVFDLTVAEKTRIGSTQEVFRILGKDKGLKVKDVFFNIEGLKYPKRTSKTIEKSIAESEGVVFGSATTLQLPEGFRMKPGDIDVIFPKRTEAELMVFTKSLSETLRRKGEKVRISPDNPLIVEFSKTRAKLLEAKSGIDPSELSGPEAANVGGLGFDFPDLKRGMIAETMPFGEARAIRAGEQMTRKGVASAFFRPAEFGETPKSFQVPGIFPTGRRTKDIAGFIVSSKGLTELRRQSFNPFKKLNIPRAKKATEKHFGTFTKEQQAEINRQIAESTGGFKATFSISPRKPATARSPYYSVFAMPRSFSLSPSQSRYTKPSPSPRPSAYKSPYPSAFRSPYKSLYSSA